MSGIQIRRESGGGLEWLGVWNCIFSGSEFQISEPEIWSKSLFFCGNSRILLEISASEKYFSDSGKWSSHTPPIHTPTKCRPIFFFESFGRDLAPYRVGNHSNPQNRAKKHEKYQKNTIFGIFGVFLPYFACGGVFLFCIRSRPGKPNQRKGQNEKFMNFAHFCEFWCFSLGKQARFTLNFCSGTPLRKVHELTFLWFGLPRPLLTVGGQVFRNESFPSLVIRPRYPPYRETGVAIPLLHCVSCGIADYRCYNPTSFLKSGLSQSKERANKGGITEEACP